MNNARTILAFAIGNILFWSVSFAAVYSILTADYTVGKADLVYTFLFHIPLVIIVLLNFWAFRFFRQNRFYSYGVLFLFLLVLGVGLHYLIFDGLLDVVDIGFYFISYYSIWQIVQFNLAYLIITLLVFLAIHWFELKSNQMVLERENSEVKLDALKAQVNPHFLINSLNNIYSLTQQNNDVANEYIVHLSDALRYMVYETKEDRVLLSEELRYLENYIALERLRLESEAKIDFMINGNAEGYLIAPLILLSFIENVFKHYSRKNPVIKISISIQNDKLHLQTKNTTEAQLKTKNSGVGQLNAENRLKLIYPGKHQLAIKEEGHIYSVDLEIDLK